MITIKQELFITEQVYKVVCNYAKKMLVKDFILKFAFQKSISLNTKIKKKDINPLLKLLCFSQGEMISNDLDEVNEFIQNYLTQLDQSDLHALYFLTFEENYLKYCQEFENNEGNEIKYHYEKFDIKFGRELAYKIYEPEASDLVYDLEKLLKANISNFSNELDLSVINKYTVEHILEIINNLYN